MECSIQKSNNRDHVTVESECPEFLIAESKCCFEITNFENFITTKRSTPVVECDIEWCGSYIQNVSSSLLFFVFNFQDGVYS